MDTEVWNESAEDGKLPKGSFEHANHDECDCTLWINVVKDDEGNVVPGAIQHFQSYKQAGSLQDFFLYIEISPETEHRWQGSEIDCHFANCHVHPNGHHPPSGKPLAKVQLKLLNSPQDVKEAFSLATKTLTETCNHVIANGGIWNEGALTQGVKKASVKARVLRSKGKLQYRRR